MHYSLHKELLYLSKDHGDKVSLKTIGLLKTSTKQYYPSVGPGYQGALSGYCHSASLSTLRHFHPLGFEKGIHQKKYYNIICFWLSRDGIIMGHPPHLWSTTITKTEFLYIKWFYSISFLPLTTSLRFLLSLSISEKKDFTVRSSIEFLCLSRT